MSFYRESLLRLGTIAFGENSEGRLGDFGKRDLIRRISAGFRQMGVFLVDSSGWSNRAARQTIREAGRDLDDSLHELGTCVYSAYFRGEIDNPVIEEECKIFAPTPSRADWLQAMGFTPIMIEAEEPASLQLESIQAA